MSLVKRNRRRKRHDIRRVLYACAAGVLCSGTIVAAHSFVLVRDSLRDEECNEITLGANTTVYDAKGRRLTTIAAEQNRQPVAFERFPQHLIDATIAIEDKRFYRHDGIDYNRIAGAAVRDATSGEGGRQGGSTITMQLMKNLCHPAEARTLSNKLSEAYSAFVYEQKHSKEYILQRYLNSVFLGNYAVGVQAASRTYFSKDVQDLTLTQAALLAGLPQAPSDYNPFRNKQAALERRNLVLSEMAKDGYITAAQAREAQKQGLGLKRSSYYGRKTEGYVVDFVEQQLINMYGRTQVTTKAGKKRTVVDRGLGRKRVRTGGLRVYTTINPKFQEHGRAVLKRLVHDRYGDSGPQAAIAMLDVETGRILTMVSTQTYSLTNRFNLAGPTAHRQAGSTFKTFVLTAMVKQGVNPETTSYFSTSPISIDGTKCADPGVSSFEFNTYSRKGGGMMNLVRATTASDNAVYVQMTCDIGPQAVYDMAKAMGIRSMVPDVDNHNLSLGLGGLTTGTNVIDMARAYAVLANGGFNVQPQAISRIWSPDGRWRTIKPVRKRVVSDAVAAEVTSVLRQNVLGGTGTSANLSNVPVAGKTGTTNDYTDAWFIGFTPRYVTAVWFGYPTSQRSTGMTGGGLPASIWRDFMSYVTAGQSNQAFPTPKGTITWVPFDGYYRGQSSALAAKAAEEEKKKEEEEKEKEKDKDKDGGDGGGTGGDGGGTGGGDGGTGGDTGGGTPTTGN